MVIKALSLFLINTKAPKVLSPHTKKETCAVTNCLIIKSYWPALNMIDK